MTEILKPGDYVLATKWPDGDPKDHWVVGFYANTIWGDRIIVVDGKGRTFRPGGFRRAEKISAELGLGEAWLGAAWQGKDYGTPVKMSTVGPECSRFRPVP